jgi:hypothetical protein
MNRARSGRSLCRPCRGFGGVLGAADPALKRWAIVGRPLARAQSRPECDERNSHPEKRPPAYPPRRSGSPRRNVTAWRRARLSEASQPWHPARTNRKLPSPRPSPIGMGEGEFAPGATTHELSRSVRGRGRGPCGCARRSVGARDVKGAFALCGASFPGIAACGGRGRAT